MRIFIANAHWFNRGDEAALMVYVNHLAEQGHDITVEIKERQPGVITSLGGQKSKRSQQDTCLRILKHGTSRSYLMDKNLQMKKRRKLLMQ